METVLSPHIHYAFILKILKSNFQINCKENEMARALFTKARLQFSSSLYFSIRLQWTPTLLWCLPYQTLYLLIVLQMDYSIHFVSDKTSTILNKRSLISLTIEIPNEVGWRVEKRIAFINHPEKNEQRMHKYTQTRVHCTCTCTSIRYAYKTFMYN